MKLDLMTAAQKVVDDTLALWETIPHACNCGGDACPVTKLYEPLNKAVALNTGEFKSSFLERQLKFLGGLFVVYQDGRSCPAPDIIRNFQRLKSEGWKRDRSMVLSGIIHRVVELSEKDYAALQLVQE